MARADRALIGALGVALLGGSCGRAAEDVAECLIPDVMALFPGDSPPNPLGQWPEATACLLTDIDAIVILGCPSETDGDPSDCQERRVELALALSAAGYTDQFIVTGAAVQNEHVEAEALRDLLVAGGIDESDVHVEPRAEHTDENLYWSTLIMQEHGWDRALVASDADHLVYAAVCDADCCVKLGRLTTLDIPTGGSSFQPAGLYELTPPASAVTDEECEHLTNPDKYMCTNLEERLACAEDQPLDP